MGLLASFLLVVVGPLFFPADPDSRGAGRLRSLVAPPYFGRFRLAARRALVVDFKLIGYSDPVLRHWLQRLVHCYGAPRTAGWSALAEMAALYRNVPADRLLRCALKFGASYAVLEIDTPTDFSEIAKTDRFRIVKIPPGAPSP